MKLNFCAKKIIAGQSWFYTIDDYKMSLVQDFHFILMIIFELFYIFDHCTDLSSH